MCWLFWALLLDPSADGHDMGMCSLLSWIPHLAWRAPQQGASQTEIVLVLVVSLFFFLLACEKVGFVLLKCVHRPHFLFLFSIKQGNPEALFFFPPFPLNFALLSSLYCKYDFRKWCVILASFMSGSPKQGVTDVHRELNVCAMVAEMVMANYTWTSFTSWPFNFSC